MQQINDEAYEAGKKCFRDGKSLRSLLEPIMEHKAEGQWTKSQTQREADEATQFSTLLGFADAFLDQVRAPY